ncbi:MAG: class I SAM-dependent DNA methyltransferase [Verrucomicrobia bacterium]|nr:class I SAM-dependent DNA methyltransferase [Verrucomicrobiota bacterium]
MPLSWNEIRHNAIRFAKEWGQIVADRRRDLHGVDHAAERALAQSFWLDFFGAFGIRKEVVRSFEVPVKMLSGSWGYIDLFWKHTLLVEHKSPGKNLAKAEQQANDYIQALVTNGRGDDVPRYVIVSDFLNIVLEDRLEGTRLEIPLDAFHKHIQAFSFLITSLKQIIYEEQDPINIEAAEVLGKLHDALKGGGYEGHDLEQFLVRILFCLFAEDTGIFELKAFQLYLENHSREDGSDLGLRLGHLFEVLNTPPEKRQKNLTENLAQFPYVNGELFSERLQFADFNRAMRATLLECCDKDWSLISPAIFGSLFQSIMQPKARRQIGAHYTSERDILKVVRSLFLDELRAEFESRKADRSTGRKARLDEFRQKLSNLRFFDPACGCGNFLVITYRELRQLEIELLSLLYKSEEQELDVRNLAQVDVHQFYGIEIEEWPARIAEVALWLMDHQMNIRLSKAFGGWYPRIPLKKSPHIHCANALRLDWKQVLPPAQCSYVLGNPPFVGAKFQNDEQRADMDAVTGDIENSGLLDYVAGWYFKAAEYIKGTCIVVGFVSTNSISQGEQVGVLWNPLFQQFGVTIHFAHRTFPWQSEARGKAHVHVIIIGFAAFDVTNKRIYEYQDDKVTVVNAKNISPYLVEGANIAVINRSQPLCDVPVMGIGNKPIDGGNYLFTPEEKAEFLKLEPAAKKFFRRWLGSEEFINGIERWCLWLGDCPPQELREMPHALARVEAVKDLRLASKSPPTKKLAATPTRFHVEHMPKRTFLVVPEVSSERRTYIPIGFMQPEILCSNKLRILPDATLFHFGQLSSAMHMAWVRRVTGRLKSDFQYSVKLVYNNYPWPETVSEKQRAAVEAAAQKVLSVRAEFLSPVGGDVRSLTSHRVAAAKKTKLESPHAVSYAGKTATLADLYDPLAMPPALVKAHADLDRAVDICYRPQPFESERQRVEFLFALYEKLTAPLIAAAKPRRGHRAKGSYFEPPPPPSKALPQGKSTPQSEADAAHFYLAKEEPPPYG